jgi:SP family facilitated glucose transporter-like MFS transporter 8
LSYASFIFDESGSELSPNLSAIVVGGIEVVGVYMTTMLVDRTGRKFLMITSALCCTCGLFAFSIYDYMKVYGYDVTAFKWVPLTSFSFTILAANFGN